MPTVEATEDKTGVQLILTLVSPRLHWQTWKALAFFSLGIHSVAPALPLREFIPHL